MSAPLILLTGVTGYVGGRMVTLLLQAGYRVRAITRDTLRTPPLPPEVEVVQADAQDSTSLAQAMQGVHTAYYLMHSMGGSEPGELTKREVLIASNFAAAAKEAKIERIIYLGGLGRRTDDLSMHLRTRHLTGDVLRTSGVPVTEFRAGVIIGSGAYSFEILRYLTERLPVMLCPRWVRTRAQPIAIQDVLRYLLEALKVPESVGRIVEIGGADVLSYAEMIQRYAAIRGLKRWLIPVPCLSPSLSAHWIDVVTPIPTQVARHLVDGLRNEVIVEDPLARELFPWEPIGYDQAVRQSLERIEKGDQDTVWSGSSTVFNLPATAASLTSDLTKREGMLIERHQAVVRASPATLWSVVQQIGGHKGWPYANRLWALRGILDRCMGGVGMRRGRRSQQEVRKGDVIDCWRVEECRPEEVLRLRAEMKLPGRGWLEFQIEALGEDHCRLVQTCFYEPHGLLGQLYWNLLLPFHLLIFPGMIRSLKKEAETLWRQKQPSSAAEQGASAPHSADDSSSGAPKS